MGRAGLETYVADESFPMIHFAAPAVSEALLPARLGAAHRGAVFMNTIADSQNDGDVRGTSQRGSDVSAGHTRHVTE